MNLEGEDLRQASNGVWRGLYFRDGREYVGRVSSADPTDRWGTVTEVRIAKETRESWSESRQATERRLLQALIDAEHARAEGRDGAHELRQRAKTRYQRLCRPGSRRVGDVSPSVRRAVIEEWEATGRVCGICSKVVSPEEKPHVDHIIPVYAGGTAARVNLRVTHARCNLQRNDPALIQVHGERRWVNRMRGVRWRFTLVAVRPSGRHETVVDDQNLYESHEEALATGLEYSRLLFPDAVIQVIQEASPRILWAAVAATQTGDCAGWRYFYVPISESGPEAPSEYSSEFYSSLEKALTAGKDQVAQVLPKAAVRVVAIQLRDMWLRKS